MAAREVLADDECQRVGAVEMLVTRREPGELAGAIAVADVKDAARGVEHNRMLEAEEAKAHTLQYMAVLKKHGLVATESEKKAEAGAKGNAAQGKRRTVIAGHSASVAPSKPTATQKTSTDLGVKRETVSRRVSEAAKGVGRSDAPVRAPALAGGFLQTCRKLPFLLRRPFRHQLRPARGHHRALRLVEMAAGEVQMLQICSEGGLVGFANWRKAEGVRSIDSLGS